MTELRELFNISIVTDTDTSMYEVGEIWGTSIEDKLKEYHEHYGERAVEELARLQLSLNRQLSELTGLPLVVKTSVDWIKTSDRLPPLETKVLISYLGDVRIATLELETPSYEETFKAFNYWCLDDSHEIDYWADVTYWAELPTPPPEVYVEDEQQSSYKSDSEEIQDAIESGGRVLVFDCATNIGTILGN